LIDFQLFKRLGLDFFPQLPDYDVGDLMTVRLRQAGNHPWACRNTYSQPELVQGIPDESPFKPVLMDRALNDNNEIIFLHMGRSVRKSQGNHFPGLTPEEWLTLIHKHVLAVTGH
jgi:hypothetical protein